MLVLVQSAVQATVHATLQAVQVIVQAVVVQAIVQAVVQVIVGGKLQTLGLYLRVYLAARTDDSGQMIVYTNIMSYYLITWVCGVLASVSTRQKMSTCTWFYLLFL